MRDDTVDVHVTRNEIGYFAHGPGLNGCHGLGDTPDEALAGFMASLETYAKTLPAPQSQALLSRPVRARAHV